MLEQLTLKKAVEFAIKTEELGSKAYEKLAKKFSEERDLADIFRVLAKEEVAHGKAFSALLRKVPDVEGAEEAGGEERWHYLRAMSISHFFGGKGGLLAQVDRIKTREDALVRAIGLEKATLQFYQAMQDLLEESEVLDSIIRAEKRHVVNLMRYIVSNAKVLQISEVEDDDFSAAAAAPEPTVDDDPEDEPPRRKRQDSKTFG